MTKVTILGKEPKEQKKKPIEFVAYVMENMTSKPNEEVLSSEYPCEFKEIQLIPHNGGYKHDLFRCVKPSGEVFFMIGHFNDGIVE